MGILTPADTKNKHDNQIEELIKDPFIACYIIVGTNHTTAPKNGVKEILSLKGYDVLHE